MKSVAGAVAADKSLAVGDGLQQSLLSLRRHRRLLVASLLGQIAGRFKEKRVVFRKRLRQELPAVLGTGRLEAVLLAQFGNNSLGERKLPILAPFHDRVLVPLRPGKHQDVRLGSISAGLPAQGEL